MCRSTKHGGRRCPGCGSYGAAAKANGNRRLGRLARKKVVAAGIPLALPDAQVLPARFDTVAQVAYLAFTAGYAPGSGPDLVRVELAGEAIRLVRLMRSTSPAARASQSLTALLALMLLQHSRRDGRVVSLGAAQSERDVDAVVAGCARRLVGLRRPYGRRGLGRGRT